MDCPVLELRAVELGYQHGFRLRLEHLAINPGELVALLGPNGSGKTMTLRLAAGTLRPERGCVFLEGLPLERLRRREIAQRLALVPQESHLPFAYTVREVVSLGRTPYASWLSGERRSDRAAIEIALELAGVAELTGRAFSELSGGERQRVILAMALAQEPRVLLLDEPTTHLDIAFQLEVLERVRHLNRTRGLTVVASLHDLNLASLFFDRLVLLHNGRLAADGPVAAVMVPEQIEAAYGARTVVQPHPTTGAPYVIVLPGSAPASGKPAFPGSALATPSRSRMGSAVRRAGSPLSDPNAESGKAASSSS